MKGLSCNKNIILKKTDKGNSVVLVNKVDYIKGMKELLSTVSKFKDTHREKAPSGKTPKLTKSRSMGIWVVDTSNQLFIRGS